MLVAAVRCFRGRPLVDGVREAGGTLLLLGSVAILLHLPFADSGFASHGPGGLLGEWLGGIAAGFIGSVGAALAATTTLVVGVAAGHRGEHARGGGRARVGGASTRCAAWSPARAARGA